MKNQGKCGSCWAFSAIGALEGLYAIQNGNIERFSEQQLIDCSTDYGNRGCNGGIMDNAFSYIEHFGNYIYSKNGQNSYFKALRLIRIILIKEKAKHAPLSRRRRNFNYLGLSMCLKIRMNN